MYAMAAIDWNKLYSAEYLMPAIRIAALLLIGFPLVYSVSSFIGRSTKRKLSPQANMLLRKGIFYTGATILLLAILNQLNFKLTALLGAAGIVGIAIGFASQTSVSNIISGIFLISERPFSVGDQIQVGTTKGIILSIDLLSVKLRTFENQLVRIPNESLIKSEFRNITYFPIRRLDIPVSVAYKESVEHVIRVLTEIAQAHPLCLDEPKPDVRFVNFGESALDFLFILWCAKDDFLALKNQVMMQIKERFDAEGIEIPFPHRSLYAGSMTTPMPICIVSEQPDKQSAEKVAEKVND